MGDQHLIEAIHRMSDMSFHLPMNQGYAWSYHGRGLRPSIPERPRLHIWEQGPEEKIKRHIFQRMEDKKETNALQEYKNQIKGCHNAERRIVKACERNENDLLMRNAYLYRYRVERSDLFDYAKPPGDILPTTGDAWAAGLRDYGVPTDPRAFATKPPKKNTEIPQQIANPREGVHYDFFCNCTKHPPPEEGSQWKPGDFYFETLQQELPKKLPFKPIFPGFEVVGESNWPPKPIPEIVEPLTPEPEKEEIPSFRGPAAKIDCTRLLLPGHIGDVPSDKVKLQNIGTTALYFTWEHRQIRPYIIKDPQPDPSRVFHVMCGTGSLVPGENKNMLFSFKSKRPGLFLEQWDVLFKPASLKPVPPLVVKGFAFYEEDPMREARENLVALLEEREMRRGIEEVNEYLCLTSMARAKPIPIVGEFLLNRLEASNFIRKNQFFKFPLYFSEELYKELLKLYKEVRLELYEEGLCTKILDTIFLAKGPYKKPEAYKGPTIKIPVHDSLLDETFPLQTLPRAVPFNPYPIMNPIQTPAIIPDDGGPVQPLTPLIKPRPKVPKEIPLVVKSEETKTLWFTADLVPPCGYGVASLRPAAAEAQGPVSLRNRGLYINTSLYPSPNAILFPNKAWIDEVSPYYAIQVDKPKFVPIPKDPTIPHNIPPQWPHIPPPPKPPTVAPYVIPPGTEKNPFWQNFWFPPLLVPPCGFGVPDLILNRTESMDPLFPSPVDSFAGIPNLVYTTVWDGSVYTILQGIAAIQKLFKRTDYRNRIATLLDAAAVPPSRYALLHVAMYKVVYDVMGALAEILETTYEDPRKTLEEYEFGFTYLKVVVENTEDSQVDVDNASKVESTEIDSKTKKKSQAKEAGKNKKDKAASGAPSKPTQSQGTTKPAADVDSKTSSQPKIKKTPNPVENASKFDANAKGPNNKVAKKAKNAKSGKDVVVEQEEPPPPAKEEPPVVVEDPAVESGKFLYDMIDQSVPLSVEIDEIKKIFAMGIDQFEDQIRIGYAAALLVIDERIKVLKQQKVQDDNIWWNIFQLETKRDDLLEEERNLLGCNELKCKYCFE